MLNKKKRFYSSFNYYLYVQFSHLQMYVYSLLIRMKELKLISFIHLPKVNSHLKKYIFIAQKQKRVVCVHKPKNSK